VVVRRQRVKPLAVHSKANEGEARRRLNCVSRWKRLVGGTKVFPFYSNKELELSSVSPDQSQVLSCASDGAIYCGQFNLYIWILVCRICI